MTHSGTIIAGLNCEQILSALIERDGINTALKTLLAIRGETKQERGYSVR